MHTNLGFQLSTWRLNFNWNLSHKRQIKVNFELESSQLYLIFHYELGQEQKSASQAVPQ